MKKNYYPDEPFEEDGNWDSKEWQGRSRKQAKENSAAMAYTILAGATALGLYSVFRLIKYAIIIYTQTNP